MQLFRAKSLHILTYFIKKCERFAPCRYGDWQKLDAVIQLMPFCFCRNYSRELSPTTARQDKTAIFGEISPIFHSFSAYFPPMVPHPPTCLWITPISAYFSPIFRLWYPILIINSSICCPFAVFPPTCLRILLIFRLKFRLFSARPVLPGDEVWRETSPANVTAAFRLAFLSA